MLIRVTPRVAFGVPHSLLPSVGPDPLSRHLIRIGTGNARSERIDWAADPRRSPVKAAKFEDYLKSGSGQASANRQFW